MPALGAPPTSAEPLTRHEHKFLIHLGGRSELMSSTVVLGSTADSSGKTDRDRRAWSSSVAIGLAFGVLAMIYSLFLFGLIEHLHVWAYSSDIWLVVDGGRFVWHGALGYVYQGSGSYSLPLSFIVMAPVSGLIDHYALIEGSPFPIGHPSAWLLVGPYSSAVRDLPPPRRAPVGMGPWTTWQTLGRSVGGGHHHSGTGVSMGSLRGRSSCHLRSSRSAQAARPRLRSRLRCSYRWPFRSSRPLPCSYRSCCSWRHPGGGYAVSSPPVPCRVPLSHSRWASTGATPPKLSFPR